MRTWYDKMGIANIDNILTKMVYIQDIVDVIGQAEEESIKYQCRRFCKIYAINNKCKIQNISYKPFPTVINNAWRVGGFCGCNGGNYEHKQDYSYTPTYQDCMKENNRDETKCNN